MELLIISGEPTAEELNEAWSSILEEFADLTLTPKGLTILEVYKKIIRTEAKIEFLDKAISILKIRYSERVALELVENGYDYVLDDENRLKNLEAIETEAKFLVVLLNQYRAEYKRLAPDSDEEKEKSELDYEKELNILSRWLKSRIKKHEISTFEYAGIIASYLEANKKPETNGSTI